MNKCELCSHSAKIHCESDQAHLCWDCDEKVHAANFLVERHSRSLLCHVCQAPTPWMASGLKLPRTVSVCVSCVSRYDDRDRNEKVVEEEREHQVVPLTMCTPPPPMEESSSSSGGESTRRCLVKRRRQDVVDLDSDDDIQCHSSQSSYNRISTTLTLRAPGDNNEASALISFKQLKNPKTSRSVRIEENHDKTNVDSNAIMCSLERFQQSSISGSKMSKTIHGFRDPRSLDLNLH